MTALVHKISDIFSDLWLDIELFFGKLFHGKKKPAQTEVLTDEKKSQPDDTLEPQLTQKKEVKEGADQKEKTKLPFSLRMLRMSVKERLHFYDTLATLTDSSVTLITSLSIIRAQTRDKTMNRFYGEMIHHINTGMSLSESMSIFPHIFPKMQAALIEAGEKSGNLSVVLMKLAEEIEAKREFSRKIIGAMFYPAIIVCLSIALVIVMMIFVVPNVAKMYDQADATLPRLTEIIIYISNFTVDYWKIIMIIFFGVLCALWVVFSKTKNGKLFWENFISIIPVIGCSNFRHLGHCS